jgi:hypothetical protein
LRVPAGWRIDWNTLFELDPTEENVRRGYFGGSSLFSATHEHRRFWIDVEWRPEDDPAGCYRMRIEYAPWERTERIRRRKDIELHFRDAEVVHQFQTPSRAELVQELETWLLRCAEWVREGS